MRAVRLVRKCMIDYFNKWIFWVPGFGCGQPHEAGCQQCAHASEPIDSMGRRVQGALELLVGGHLYLRCTRRGSILAAEIATRALHVVAHIAHAAFLCAAMRTNLQSLRFVGFVSLPIPCGCSAARAFVVCFTVFHGVPIPLFCRHRLWLDARVVLEFAHA